MNRSQFFKLLVSIAVCELAGIIGSIFTTSSISTWYTTLVTPALNPPNWVFGPVWVTLYLLMGVAAFLICNKGFDRTDVKKALGVFGLQLALNASWSIVFFGLQNPAWAFAVIVAMWVAIVWTMALFNKISKLATWFLVPYILWVSFASYLNYSIWILNS